MFETYYNKLNDVEKELLADVVLNEPFRKMVMTGIVEAKNDLLNLRQSDVKNDPLAFMQLYTLAQQRMDFFTELYNFLSSSHDKFIKRLNPEQKPQSSSEV